MKIIALFLLLASSFAHGQNAFKGVNTSLLKIDYESNIGSTFGARSLIDKGYADSVAAAAATTINNIGDATGAGLVTIGNNSQQWDFTGLTGSGLLIQSNTTAATNNLHKVLRVITTGANGSASVKSYASQIINSHTGTSSTNVGLDVSALNGTNNHAITVDAGNGNVGFGTPTPNSNAILELSSTTQGLLLPRMTSTQRTAISSPTAGLQVFDTDTASTFQYNGSAWQNLYNTGSSSSGTYSPTLTNVTNLTSSSELGGKWFRVGDMVTWSGRVEVTPAGSGLIELRLTLPVASALVNEYDLTGVATNQDNKSGHIAGDQTNDAAYFRWIAPGTGTVAFRVTYTYQVL